MVQCVTCGGVYDEVLADGQKYYHECPPLSVVELAAAVKSGRVTLPLGETLDIAIARRVYLRTRLRDENVVPPERRGDKPTLKADGRGVTQVAPLPSSAPILVPD